MTVLGLRVGAARALICMSLLFACACERSDKGSGEPKKVAEGDEVVGCRGPADPGCATCKLDDEYLSGSDGSSDYDLGSLTDETGCEPGCPVCATCRYCYCKRKASLSAVCPSLF